jgi:hypothetical protein
MTASFKCLPSGKQNFISRKIGEAVKPETRDKRIHEEVVAAHGRRENVSDNDSGR